MIRTNWFSGIMVVFLALASVTSYPLIVVADPVFATDAEAATQARALGYVRINERSHGAAVFRRGNRYISRDRDGHNGGAWKVADSVENLASRDTRLGTWNADLTVRVGD